MVHILIGGGEDISGILEQRIGELDAGVEGLRPAVQSARLTAHQAWGNIIHHIDDAGRLLLRALREVTSIVIASIRLPSQRAVLH